MVIYHGSPKIIEVPAYGLGSATNEYYSGFYCTEDIELAKEWSCPTVQNGFSNKYELDISDLKVLYLNKAGYNLLNWIAILLDNRTFSKRSTIARQASEYMQKNIISKHY